MFNELYSDGAMAALFLALWGSCSAMLLALALLIFDYLDRKSKKQNGTQHYHYCPDCRALVRGFLLSKGKDQKAGSADPKAREKES